MAFQFPELDKLIAAAESDLVHSYSHMTSIPQDRRDDGEHYTPTSVGIDPSNNRIYVITKARTLLDRVFIYVYSEVGKFLRKFPIDDLKNPCGIAIQCDSIYITDSSRHCIFHFKSAEDICIVACVGVRGSGIEQFNMPMLLAVSMNGDLFITDLLNDRIQILDKDMKYQRHISHHSMRRPCDVKLTAEEVFVMSTHVQGPNVHVFTYTGEKLRSIIPRGCFKMGQVGKTYSLCVYPDGNLVVIDLEAQQINVFSKEGSYLHPVGMGGDKRIRYPVGIALTPNLKLIVLSKWVKFRLLIFAH